LQHSLGSLTPSPTSFELWRVKLNLGSGRLRLMLPRLLNWCWYALVMG